MGKSRRAEALALLGIARRAGAVVKGTDAVRRAVRSGEARLVVVAEDGSETQIRKVVPLLRARDVPWGKLGTKLELGAAVGSGSLTMVAVTAASFAKQLGERIRRI